MIRSKGVLHDAALVRGIKIYRGWSLDSSVENANSIIATFTPWSLNMTPPLVGESVAGAKSIAVKYLVGCDGANSTVRRLAGIEMFDLGFKSDWLVSNFFLTLL